MDSRTWICRVCHFRQELHEIEGHGSGIVRVEHLVPYLVLYCTHKTCLVAVFCEYVLDIGLP